MKLTSIQFRRGKKKVGFRQPTMNVLVEGPPDVAVATNLDGFLKTGETNPWKIGLPLAVIVKWNLHVQGLYTP